MQYLNFISPHSDKLKGIAFLLVKFLVEEATETLGGG